MICTVIWFQVFLSNTNDFQAYLFNPQREPKHIIPHKVQSGPGSNGNKRAATQTPDLQNWSLIIRHSFVSYSKNLFLVGAYTSARDSDSIF